VALSLVSLAKTVVGTIRLARFKAASSGSSPLVRSFSNAVYRDGRPKAVARDECPCCHKRHAERSSNGQQTVLSSTCGCFRSTCAHQSANGARSDRRLWAQRNQLNYLGSVAEGSWPTLGAHRAGGDGESGVMLATSVSAHWSNLRVPVAMKSQAHLPTSRRHATDRLIVHRRSFYLL
jgi:hypothetical protein